MFRILILALAWQVAQGQTRFCIQQRINSSMDFHGGAFGGVFATGSEKLVEPREAKKGISFPEVPRGAAVTQRRRREIESDKVPDWWGFGDSRTDKTAVCSGGGTTQCKDVTDMSILDRFSSKSGASILESYFGVPGQQVFMYQGEGQFKVFYEGVNWGFSGDCFFTEDDGTNARPLLDMFYQSIYENAAKYRGLEMVNLLVTTTGRGVDGNTAPVTVTEGHVYPNCGGSFLANPRWDLVAARPTTGCTEMTTKIQIPAFGPFGANDKCVVPRCFFQISRADFERQTCGNYMIKWTDELGVVNFMYDSNVDGFPTPTNTYMSCFPMELKPGVHTLVARGWALVPTRAICFSGKQQTTPVVVYESPWPGRDTIARPIEACKKVGACIPVERETPYLGTGNNGADTGHGDLEARRTLDTLALKNTSCYFNGKFHTDGDIIGKERLTFPRAGNCPYFIRDENIPVIPNGLMIPHSGTNHERSNPNARFFGIDDIILGIGFLIALGTAGAAGYFFGHSSSGGLSEEDIGKLKNDLSQLRTETNNAIKNFNDRVGNDERAIIELRDELDDVRAESLLNELMLIKDLIVSNISMQLTSSLKETANIITARAKGIAIPAGEGCWEFNEKCDEECQKNLLNFKVGVDSKEIGELDLSFGGAVSGGIIPLVISIIALVIGLLSITGLCFLKRRV